MRFQVFSLKKWSRLVCLSLLLLMSLPSIQVHAVVELTDPLQTELVQLGVS